MYLNLFYHLARIADRYYVGWDVLCDNRTGTDGDGFCPFVAGVPFDILSFGHYDHEGDSHNRNQYADNDVRGECLSKDECTDKDGSYRLKDSKD